MSSKARLTRRGFLKVGGMAAATGLLAACGATPTVTPVPPTATKPPAATNTPVPAAPTATKPAATATAAPAAPTATKPPATAAPAPTTAPAATGALKTGGTLRMATPNPASALIMVSSPNRPYYFMLHELLYTLDEKTGDLVPRLADGAPQWSSDGKTLTVKIKANAKFHDGKPVTAKDVIFSWSVMADPRTGSNQSALFANIVGADATKAGTAPLLSGMKAVDDKTVQVSLLQQDPLFLNKMAQSNQAQIWPSHILENEPRDKFKESTFWQNQVGTGAFKWAKYVKDQRLELERFDDYFGGKPLLDKVTIDMVTNANAQIAAFEKGDYDLIFAIPSAEAARLAKNSKVKVISTWRGRADSIVINHTATVQGLSDPRFKKALMYAIDRETIADTIYANKLGGRAHYSNLMDPWAMSPKPNPFKYDPKMAKDLLAQMKWNASQEVLLTASPDRMPLATVLQQYCTDVGIKVVVRQVDETTERALRDANQLNFNLSAESAALIPETLYNTTACKMAPPAGRNDSKYCNEKVDAQWTTILANTDLSKRPALFQPLDELFRDDPVWIPVVEVAQPWVFSDPFVVPADAVSWQAWCSPHKWGFR